MTSSITLTYEPDSEYSRERLGPVTLTVPHGDVWAYLVDDFVAFLRLTGYHIDEPWVDEYSSHKKLGERAAQLLSELEYDKETGSIIWNRDGRDDESRDDVGEDEVEPTSHHGRNSTPTRRRGKSKRPPGKKTKKKAKK